MKSLDTRKEFNDAVLVSGCCRSARARIVANKPTHMHYVIIAAIAHVCIGIGLFILGRANDNNNAELTIWLVIHATLFISANCAVDGHIRKVSLFAYVILSGVIAKILIGDFQLSIEGSKGAVEFMLASYILLCVMQFLMMVLKPAIHQFKWVLALFVIFFVCCRDVRIVLHRSFQ